VDRSEAGRVVGSINGLLGKIQSILNALIAAKSAIIASGGRSVIYNSLRDQERAAQDFGNALNYRMPAGEGIGSAFISRVRAAFDQALRAFA
jgi:hypothetical protein